MYLRSLEVHVPLWRDGINLDNLQVAWIEASHKHTRLAVIKIPPRDRFLGAFRTSCLVLGKLGCLQQLSLILPAASVHKWMTDNAEATEDMPKDKRDRYLKRKGEEVQVFERLSAALPKLRITIVVEPTDQLERDEVLRSFGEIEDAAKARG